MKRYPKIKVTVSCLPKAERAIKNIFYDILDDYCKRYSIQVLDKKFAVQICLVEYDEESTSQGLTTFAEEEGKILVQMRDPFLNEWEPNMYTLSGFLEILSHELVHVCQNLTGRQGFKIPKFKYDKKNKREEYFFDPSEVEARVLAAPYAILYAERLI